MTVKAITDNVLRLATLYNLRSTVEKLGAGFA